MKCFKSFIIQHCWFNYLNYEKKALLAGQSHSGVFGSPVEGQSLLHTLNSNYTAHAQSTYSLYEGGGPYMRGSLSRCLLPSCARPVTSSHFHAPGSLKEAMVSPRPIRHWNSRGMKHRRSAQLCLPARPSLCKAKACPCNLQGIKSMC